MNSFQRVIIAVALGLGVILGSQWLARQMGYSDAQINGTGGIGFIIAGAVTIIGFLKVTERNKDR